ncbi:hypothetical protein PUNSTDRAFT_145203 [Punctularia strigosozonata HHB-11173 SS5]|uniref:uncharacterized protein n=1 Tax=Punctularia strigosozonata (strain HHB-11173) TaxID=741275 RepID=UPI00044175C9|nr:uncharacterized protein PUNSTDRAFT_145203 [Punctularia strigosozonata HHB-11173 SS5]EIN06665.1 hypothetical protein PUNSTDRAFT_145203 [Punctularia strigosozonata HHB-11173 SS5]
MDARIFRTLPRASGHDVSTIKGNLSPDDKQTLVNLLAYYVGAGEVYSNDVGKKIRITEVDVRKTASDEPTWQSESVCEILVENHMLNPHGVLHGGCMAYLVDLCSSVPIVAIALVSGSAGVGFSQAMNIIWHAPAKGGTTLSIVGKSLSVGKNILTCQCEIWDKEKGKLLATAVHSKVQPEPKNAPRCKL